MKYSDKKNKITGLLQKLPRQAVEEILSEVAESSHSSPHREIVLPESAILHWMTQPTPVVNDLNAPIDQFPAVDQTTRQTERLGNLIHNEVITFKVTGVNELAVSLKVDSQTEIFLGLTQRDGHIQASIRCESGSLAGIEGHWTQLQESLARHNVQLLPLEQNHASKDAPFQSHAENASGQFEQAPKKQPHEPDGLDFAEEFLSAPVARKSGVANKAVKQFIPQGWESWV
ncbi:MAG: hypothetical protein ABJC04_01480 [Verrucomicrobiota bacterium]